MGRGWTRLEIDFRDELELHHLVGPGGDAAERTRQAARSPRAGDLDAGARDLARRLARFWRRLEHRLPRSRDHAAWGIGSDLVQLFHEHRLRHAERRFARARRQRLARCVSAARLGGQWWSGVAPAQTAWERWDRNPSRSRAGPSPRPP